MPSILIINPNSSVSITETLKGLLEPPPDFRYTFFTGPSATRCNTSPILSSQESVETPATIITSTTTLSDDDDVRSQDSDATAANSDTCSNKSCISLDSWKSTSITDSSSTQQFTLLAPSQIDSWSTSVISAAACMPHVIPLIAEHDAFLVACFSDHPLVGMLREAVPAHKPVMGIFQASVLSSLAMGTRFAIVTTATIWERLLDEAVASMIGSSAAIHYAGTYSTGLGVLEIHELPMQTVKKKLVACAVKAVRERGATAIVLGCAGLSGLDSAIREAVGLRWLL